MKKAAIFDLDGTLILKTSAERIFFNYLFKNGEIHLIDITRTVFKIARNIGPWNRMILHHKYYLKGKSFEKMKSLANICFLDTINKYIPIEMTRIIQSHRDNGDLLIIISGTLGFVLDIFSQKLCFCDKKGTAMEIRDGVFTGEIEGIYPHGYGKVEVLNTFLKKYEIDLVQSSVYANHFTDRFLMEQIGNPVAVNPDFRLLRYAKSRGWRVIRVSGLKY